MVRNFAYSLHEKTNIENRIVLPTYASHLSNENLEKIPIRYAFQLVNENLEKIPTMYACVGHCENEQNTTISQEINMKNLDPKQASLKFARVWLEKSELAAEQLIGREKKSSAELGFASNQRQNTYLLNLPDELLLKICSYLQKPSWFLRLSVQPTCKRLSSIVQDKSLRPVDWEILEYLEKSMVRTRKSECNPITLPWPSTFQVSEQPNGREKESSAELAVAKQEAGHARRNSEIVIENYKKKCSDNVECSTMYYHSSDIENGKGGIRMKCSLALPVASVKNELGTTTYTDKKWEKSFIFSSMYKQSSVTDMKVHTKVTTYMKDVSKGSTRGITNLLSYPPASFNMCYVIVVNASANKLQKENALNAYYLQLYRQHDIWKYERMTLNESILCTRKQPASYASELTTAPSVALTSESSCLMMGTAAAIIPARSSASSCSVMGTQTIVNTYLPSIYLPSSQTEQTSLPVDGEIEGLGGGGELKRFIYSPPYNTISQTLRCNIIAANGVKKSGIRVFIDNGSQLSIIHTTLMEELDLKNENRSAVLGMWTSGGKNVVFPHQYICYFQLESMFGNYTSELIEAISCPHTTIPITQNLTQVKHISYLQHVNDWVDRYPMSFEYWRKNKHCSILLGEPFASRIVKSITTSTSPDLPSAVHSYLGSFLCGATGRSSIDTGLLEVQELRDTMYNHVAYPISMYNTTTKSASLEEQLHQFFSLENLGIQNIYTGSEELSYNEMRADKIIAEGTTYNAIEKRYTTTFPWDIAGPPKCSNKKAAFASSMRTLKKCMRQKEKWEQLIVAFKKLRKNKFIELVPHSDLLKIENMTYLSWSTVFKASSTNPCRIVYCANQPLSCSCIPPCGSSRQSDGASRKQQSVSKKSLNEYMLKGPDLLNNLASCLIRWRKTTYVGVTDISNMYSRISLDSETRDHTRFFFCSDYNFDSMHEKESGIREQQQSSKKGQNELRLQTYRHTAIPFGIRSSPMIVCKILKIHVSQQKFAETEELRQSQLHLLHDIFMDDILFYDNCSQNLRKKANNLKYICDLAGLPTQKYFSNVSCALEDLSPEVINHDISCSVLGLKYNKITDNFSINFFKAPTYKSELECQLANLYCDNELSYMNKLAHLSDPVKKAQDDEFIERIFHEKEIMNLPLFTKRQALSLIAKVFDILGMISPFLLQGKLIMQASWAEPNCAWDKVLPKHLQERMHNWASQLHKLHDFTIPRCIAPNSGTIIELVTLVDASLLAMSAVCYVVSTGSCGKKLNSRLVYTKTKVKPKKLETQLDTSICRLELIGALLGCITSKFVLDSLRLEVKPRLKFYSDSQVTLHRLAKSNIGEYKLFTYNRLKKIKEMTNSDTWHYLDTKANFSSDIASRSADLDSFIYSDEWKYGPKILVDPLYKPIRIGPYSAEHQRMDEREKKVENVAKGLDRLSSQFTATTSRAATKAGPQQQSSQAADKNSPRPSWALPRRRNQVSVATLDAQAELPKKEDANKIPNTITIFWEHKLRGLLYRYNSFRKLIKVLAWMLHFLKRCKAAVAKKKERGRGTPNQNIHSTRMPSANARYPSDVHCTSSRYAKYPSDVYCTSSMYARYIPNEVHCTSKAYLNKQFLSDLQIKEAKNMIYRFAQESCFDEELKLLQTGHELDSSSKVHQRCTLRKRIFKLVPYWDKDTNLIRIKSRTPQLCANPAVLPGKHRVTWLYLRQIHLDHYHCGISQILHHANYEAVALGGRKSCASILKGCVCRAPIPLYQRQSTLPTWRYLLEEEEEGKKAAEQQYTPYQICGMDFAGPFRCTAAHACENECAKPIIKTFVLIISCLHTRHITAILCPGATTQHVIAALRELVSIRGAFRIMFCDSAKQFIKASRELRKILVDINWDDLPPAFDKFTSRFIFSTPASPTTNGINETVVKIWKGCLKKAVGSSLLEYENLRLVASEAASMANERPLSFVSTPDSLGGIDEVITPSQLVSGRKVGLFPADMTKLNYNVDIQQQYKVRKEQLNRFWGIWKNTYFASLSLNKHWPKKLEVNLEPNMYVLLRDTTLKKEAKFIPARLVEAIKGRDGLPRTVRLKITGSNKILERHIGTISIPEFDFLKLTSDFENEQPWRAAVEQAGLQQQQDPSNISGSTSTMRPNVADPSSTRRGGMKCQHITLPEELVQDELCQHKAKRWQNSGFSHLVKKGLNEGQSGSSSHSVLEGSNGGYSDVDKNSTYPKLEHRELRTAELTQNVGVRHSGSNECTQELSELPTKIETGSSGLCKNLQNVVKCCALLHSQSIVHNRPSSTYSKNSLVDKPSNIQSKKDMEVVPGASIPILKGTCSVQALPLPAPVPPVPPLQHSAGVGSAKSAKAKQASMVSQPIKAVIRRARGQIPGRAQGQPGKRTPPSHESMIIYGGAKAGKFSVLRRHSC